MCAGVAWYTQRMARTKEKIEVLEAELYKRGHGPAPKPRHTLEPTEEADVASAWDGEQDETVAAILGDSSSVQGTASEGAAVRYTDPSTEDVSEGEPVSPASMGRARPKRSYVGLAIKGILGVSILFFFGAAGYVAWSLFAGDGAVTCGKIGFDFQAPASVGSGEDLLLDVGVTNNNPVALTNAQLTFKYPDGTRSAEDSSILMPSQRESIGVIDPGETVTVSSRATLYGKEQSVALIGATLEYGLVGSNAKFTCEAEQDIRITTAPVSLSVEGLEEIASGQQLELRVRVRSNSSRVVSDQRLVAEYPFGFEFVSAEPEPTVGNNVWDVGDVAPGTEQVYVIRGIVQAQTVEARTARFSLGEASTDDTKLAHVLQFAEHALVIERPFMSLELTLEGSADTTVSVPVGAQVHGSLHWKNTQQEPLYNVSIESVLPTEFLQRDSVSVRNGYFRSVDNTMLWTPQTYSGFAEVPPGATGQLNFSFTTDPFTYESGAADATVDLSFDVSARRVADVRAVQQELVGQSPRVVRFITDLTFEPSLVYSIGPFLNTGPHPPRVDTPTTYTVVWDVESSINDMKNVRVQGVLPIYVEWLDEVDPVGADLSYNETTRVVTWNVGELPAGGDGVAAFQVRFVPSVTHRRNTVSIVRELSARGVDVVTGRVIERGSRSLTTGLTKDPRLSNVSGNVTN